MVDIRRRELLMLLGSTVVAVNPKTATALGISVKPTLLSSADEVTE
jgi:hypothetical protein